MSRILIVEDEQDLAVGLAVLMLVWAIKNLSEAVSVVAVLVVPLFWAYLLAVLLLVEWAILRWTKYAFPCLPFVPDRWSGHRTSLIVLVAFVGIVTLFREGAFAPGCMLEFNWYTAHTKPQAA